MLSLLVVRTRRVAADMGSGLVVIASALLAITVLFVLAVMQSNSIDDRTYQYANNEKPAIESSLEETGTISVVVP